MSPNERDSLRCILSELRRICRSLQVNVEGAVYTQLLSYASHDEAPALMTAWEVATRVRADLITIRTDIEKLLAFDKAISTSRR